MTHTPTFTQQSQTITARCACGWESLGHLSMDDALGAMAGHYWDAVGRAA